MIRSSEQQRVSSGELFYMTHAHSGGHRGHEVEIQAILLSPIVSNTAPKREATVRTWFHVVQSAT